MCLARRAEVGFDAEVDAQRAALEPAAAARRQRLWLGNPGDAEKPLVERSGPVLLAGRHRQLHVVDAFHLRPVGSGSHVATASSGHSKPWPVSSPTHSSPTT